MPADSPLPFAHWMLREIYEQPQTLAATLSRYVEIGAAPAFRADACAPVRAWLSQLHGEIVVAASGSSRHAGMVAELTIEDLSGIMVDVEYASEYSYRSEAALKNAGVLVVSQSGETADTLAALRKAHAAGHATLAVTNVEDSTMAREATVSLPTEAGRERAIPATKSFTAQLLLLHLVALLAAESRGSLDAAQTRAHLAAAAALPELLQAQLPAWESAVSEIATHFTGIESFLFLGRGIHYPIAREGALKLKESAYLHAEGYPSGELKHGPNALVGDRTPLVMLACYDPHDAGSIERYERSLHLMRDMRAQGAPILALANVGDMEVAALATHTITVPQSTEWLLPILEVIPLQLFSYFMSINHGIDVDRPRNLVKAVVEE